MFVIVLQHHWLYQSLRQMPFHVLIPQLNIPNRCWCYLTTWQKPTCKETCERWSFTIKYKSFLKTCTLPYSSMYFFFSSNFDIKTSFLNLDVTNTFDRCFNKLELMCRVISAISPSGTTLPLQICKKREFQNESISLAEPPMVRVRLKLDKFIEIL